MVMWSSLPFAVNVMLNLSIVMYSWCVWSDLV